MIVDQLQNRSLYLGINPLFKQAFEYLTDPAIRDLENGKHSIINYELFAIIDRGKGKGREKAMLEYHKQFIDIQFVVAGQDVIGWSPTDCCQRKNGGFDVEKDLGFFFDRPETWLNISAGSFAIFYPSDAHAPLACEGDFHKAVLKIRVK